MLIAGYLAMLAATAPTVAPPPHQTRPQKIAELTADLGYGSDIKHVDAAIAALAAGVAPADPTWNPSHRHWAAVRGLIKTHLHEDADLAYGETEVQIREGAERALDDGVLGEDLDFALAFFRSDVGLRFQELENRLIDLSIEISLEKGGDAAGPSLENLDARRRIVELWLPIVFIQAVQKSQSGERAIDAAYERFSTLRGPQVDALAQRYAADLPQFESFVHSASFGRIIDAEKFASPTTPAPNLGAFFSEEARRHGAEWHAAYLAP
jgi:hypothetical protein